jgi:IS5 family transposase
LDGWPRGSRRDNRLGKLCTGRFSCLYDSESTILRFRHLLEQHQLTEKIFGLVRSLLESKRLLLKSGTIVDATIIDAPPSTLRAISCY